jgi:hypothetical protein
MVDRFRAITYVLRQEASINLGLAGKKLRVATETLRHFDAQARGPNASGGPNSPRRRELLHNAAHALSAYVIQREALGIRDDQAINAEFGITREIWNLVGALPAA